LGNVQARISPATLARLVDDARRVVSYQEPLALRRDAGGDLDGLPDILVAETTQNLRDQPPDCTPERAVRRPAGSSEVTPELLIGILQAGRSDLFEALIGKVTGLNTYALRHVLYDPDGKALATICRAISIPRKQFVGLYLLVLRTQAASGVTPAREISAVVRHFDRLTPTAASQAIADWRGDDRFGVAERADSTAG
jgi:hypothetical protein